MAWRNTMGSAWDFGQYPVGNWGNCVLVSCDEIWNWISLLSGLCETRWAMFLQYPVEKCGKWVAMRFWKLKFALGESWWALDDICKIRLVIAEIVCWWVEIEFCSCQGLGESWWALYEILQYPVGNCGNCVLVSCDGLDTYLADMALNVSKKEISVLIPWESDETRWAL